MVTNCFKSLFKAEIEIYIRSNLISQIIYLLRIEVKGLDLEEEVWDGPLAERVLQIPHNR